MTFPFLPLLFIALPFVEIAGFVLVGSQIGALATVGLALATSILGGVLLRIQGFGALMRIRETMERGGAPGRDLVHGLMIAIAGVLLLLPGFVTDAVGLLLFVPPVRELGWRLVKDRIVVVDVAAGSFRRGPAGGRTIDLDADDYARNEGGEEPEPRRRVLGKDR